MYVHICIYMVYARNVLGVCRACVCVYIDIYIVQEPPPGWHFLVGFSAWGLQYFRVCKACSSGGEASKVHAFGQKKSAGR